MRWLLFIKAIVTIVHSDITEILQPQN